VLGEPILESNNGTFKYTFPYESFTSDSEHYFAFALPYPYSEIQKNQSLFEKMTPSDCYFHREVLCRSIDGRDIDLLTISHKSNMAKEREDRPEDIFPCFTPRPFKSLKPVIFISARVHPGETPSSFLLDGILMVILGNDSKGQALRNNFVFKIVPVLNPDGVFRGNFRVDQNGVNLNRCYLEPSQFDHPSIFAVRKYLLTLHNIRYYFDLHAHMSKKSSFLFGNFLGERQAENQVFAKLIEINSQYFDFNDCDFSEKSMSAKDPKDIHSKEASGRVTLYSTFGVIHSYTIECSYFIPRPLHLVPQTTNVKTGKRFNESIYYNSSCLSPVHNRGFFNELAAGLLMALLDLEGLNPNSRVPLSEFKTIETISEYLKARNQLNWLQAAQGALNAQGKISRNLLRSESKKPDSKILEKTTLPKLPLRKVHKLHVISPIFSSIPHTLYQKPRPLQTRTKSVLKS
jgi:hypothetical protein